MTTDTRDPIYEELRAEIDALDAGDPIPSVRRLMARFSVSQVVIDRVMNRLREEYSIVSQVGRGSFKGDAQPASEVVADVIQFYMPDVVSTFQQEVLREITAAVDAHDLRLAVHRYPWNKVPGRLIDTPDTAAILMVPPSFLSAAELAVLESATVPIVMIDHIPHGLRLHGVASDNALGGAMAANHLLGQGLTQLAMISAEPGTNANVGARLRGFQRQCRLSEAPEPIMVGQSSGPGSAVADAAYRTMRDFLKKGELPFEGIFADSAPTAMGVITACREAGISIPEQLALVAFDDTPESRYMHPTITVIKQDVPSWASKAMDIVEQCRSGHMPAYPQHTQVPPMLIARESSQVIYEADSQLA